MAMVIKVYGYSRISFLEVRDRGEQHIDISIIGSSVNMVKKLC